jgi:hypothetical protein
MTRNQLRASTSSRGLARGHVSGRVDNYAVRCHPHDCESRAHLGFFFFFFFFLAKKKKKKKKIFGGSQSAKNLH